MAHKVTIEIGDKKPTDNRSWNIGNVNDASRKVSDIVNEYSYKPRKDFKPFRVLHNGHVVFDSKDYKLTGK